MAANATYIRRGRGSSHAGDIQLPEIVVERGQQHPVRITDVAACAGDPRR